MKTNLRLTSIPSDDFYIKPTNFLPNSRSEGLRNRFLGRKSRCEMDFRAFLPVAVFPLCGGENTIQESLAKFVEGRLYAAHLNNIDSYSN
jgi:hypothetical protein